MSEENKSSTIVGLELQVRNECLLEEIIFQLIMLRFPGESIEFYNEKFNIALKNIETRASEITVRPA